MSNTVFPAQVRGLGYTVVKSPEDAVLKQQAASWEQTRIVQSLNPIWHWNLLYDFLIDNPLKPNAALAYTDLQTLLGFVTARRNSWDDFLYLDPDDNFFGPGVITQPWVPGYPYSLYTIVIASGHAQQLVLAPPGSRSGVNGTPIFSTAGATATDGVMVWQDLGAAIGGTLWPNPFAQLQLVTDGTNFYTPLQMLRGGQGYYEDIFDLAGGLTVYDNGVITTNYQLQFGGISIPGFSSSGLFLLWNSQPTGPITATFNYYYRVHFEDDTEDFEKWANQWWTVGGSEGSKGKGELKLTSSRVPSALFNGLPGGAPAPPIPFPAGATQFVVIYPTTVTLSNGSGPGLTTGQAWGAANGTANSWYEADIYFQGLGSVGGSATFSGFSLPPWLPASAVKAVYAHTAYNYIKLSNTAGAMGRWGTAALGNTPNFLYTNISVGGGLFINTTRLDLASNIPVGIANFPYATLLLQYSEGSLNFVRSTDRHLGLPSVVVFY